MNKPVKPNNSWTLFLDRDGIINKNPENDYVKNISEFEFIEKVPENLKQLSKVFGRIIIVTNQQGIGKGLMSEKDLNDIHQYMNKKILNAGGRIDKIYHCPDLDNTGSKDRKPETGMGLKAKADFPEINFSKSIMVGDKISDVAFGKKLNMFAIIITKDIKYLNSIDKKNWDNHFSSFKEFTDWTIKMTS